MISRQSVVVYVAGPFRGPHSWAIENNIRRAEELAWKVWEQGFTAISPHCNTRYFQHSLPDHIWLDGDLEILKRCDVLLLTPDWERSEGTRIEKEFAEEYGIPVVYDIEHLVIVGDELVKNARDAEADYGS